MTKRSERTAGAEHAAGGVERALYLARGSWFFARRGKIWLFDDELLLRRGREKRPLARVDDVRSIEHRTDEWLGLERYRFELADTRFDLCAPTGAAELHSFVASIADQRGIEVDEQEAEPLLWGHVARLWDAGAAGRLVVAAEGALVLLLLVYAYAA